MSIASPTAVPFGAIASNYDEEFSDSLIGRAQRAQVLGVADRIFQPGQTLLELNCGTGVDAAHFGQRGINVLATDSSPEMIAVARRRCREFSNVRCQACSIERLGSIRGDFDGVFSNFSGLNCVLDLESFGEQLARLVRPGGSAVLIMFGTLCAWETVWYLLRGEYAKAFRRRRRGVTQASIGNGNKVCIRYHSVRELRAACAPEFRLREWRAIGAFVPPSYLEPFATTHARLIRWAGRLDRHLGGLPLVRSVSDHVLVHLERTAG